MIEEFGYLSYSIGGLLVVYLTFQIISVLKNNNQLRIIASIERITPIYIDNGRAETTHLKIDFSYIVERQLFSGVCEVDINYFIGSIIPPEPIIYYDNEIELNVLLLDDEKKIGNEHIEDYFLSKKSKIPIYFFRDKPEIYKYSEEKFQILKQIERIAKLW